MKNFSRKHTLIFLCMLMACLCFTACGCEHEWSDATCLAPSTCTKCGKTQGELGDHTWIEATCTSPRTCKVCKLTDGDALGHKWESATCVLPETCSVCKETRGEALGHKWKDATCTSPKQCEVCSAVEGKALGHKVSEWTIVTEPTCSETGERKGICETCGEKVSESIKALGHEAGDVEVITPATLTSTGEKGKKCKVCGEYLATFSYNLSGEELEQAFKDACTKYSYKQIARNPDAFVSQMVYFKGEVIQVLESGNTIQLRVNVTNNGYYWTDTIFVQYTRNSGEGRILENDIIKIYGYGAGTITYESVLGAQVTIPAVLAEYIDY